MKKKFLLSLVVGLAAILSCCFSFNVKHSVAYAAAQEVEDCYYLINNTTPYMANEPVGSASGYGEYAVGEKNISISASALTGYKLVGWQVVLTEQNVTKFITTNTTLASSPKSVTLQGTLNFETQDTVKYNTEDVTVYSNATDGVNTYYKLYKDTEDNYFTLSFVEIEVTYSDLNGDGSKDGGELKIAEVFENMKVIPVFDFIYYQLDITSFVDKIKLPANSIPSFGEYTVYYEPNPTPSESGYVEVINTILKDSENKYFYVGDAYVDMSKGKAYAKHSTLEDSAKVQYVDMIANGGAFRLGQEIEFNLDVNIVSNIKESANIEVVSATSNSLVATNLTTTIYDGISTKPTLNSNSCIVTIDEYKRATNLDVKLEIKNIKSLINTLNVNYKNLYVVDINRTIDGATANDYDVTKYTNVTVNAIEYEELYCREGEYYTIRNKSRIPVEVPADANLGAGEVVTLNDVKQFFTISADKEETKFINVNNYYSIIDTENFTSYLVKSAVDNGGFAFNISCASEYSEVVGKKHTYYTFNKIDNLDETNKSFTTFAENKTINIDYSTAKYSINYTTALVNNGNINFVTLENNLESEKLKIGQPATISSYASNVGYQFVGYAYTNFDDATSLPTTLNEKINFIAPDDINIIVCYKYVDYTLQIYNINKINIGTSYPISSITMDYISDKEEINSFDRSENSVEFTKKLHIKDLISLSYKLNNGFKLYGLSLTSGLTGDELTNEKNFINNLTINKSLISSLGENTTIVLYAYEDYTTYTITYYIEPAFDQTTSENVIMAQLDVELDVDASEDAAIVRKNIAGGDITEDGVTDTIVATIEISNLKLNDIVNLTSVGKEYQTGKIYQFNWFMIDGRTPLTPNSSLNVSLNEGTNTYTFTETVFTNRSIKVVYSLPETQLIVSVNNTNAYELFTTNEEDIVNKSNLKVSENSNESSFVANATVLKYKFESGSTIKIELLPQILNFGYILTGFKLNGENVEEEKVNINSLSCEFVASEGVQTLEICFAPIEYRFVIKQNGGGFNGEQYSEGFIFNDEEGTENDYYYTILTIENRTLSITKPEGYYVNTAKINATNHELLAEDNSYKTSNNITLYNFTFTETEFASFVQTFGSNKEIEVFTLEFNYEIFTYDIKIKYILYKDETIDPLNGKALPNIILLYNGSQTISYDATEDFGIYAFKGIPYKAEVTISVGDSIAGISKVGWYVGNSLFSDGAVTCNINTFNVTDIIKDYNVDFVLKYVKYYIALVADNTGAGNPEVIINDIVRTEDAYAYVGDKIVVKTGANIQGGYNLDCLAYRYKHNPETWDVDWENVYVASASGYIKNASDEYDETKEYYICTKDAVFAINSLSVSDYVVEYVNDKAYINFNIHYCLLEITIINNSQERSGPSIVNDAIEKDLEKDMHIALEDFATYTVQAVNNLGKRTIGANDTVTIDDRIIITVQLNDKAVNREPRKNADGSYALDAEGNFIFDYIEGDEYDLRYGLLLIKDYINIYVDTFTNLGNGCYEFSFYIVNILTSLPIANPDTLTINYSYEVLNKELAVTTNITNLSFYEDGNDEIGIDDEQYHYGDTDLPNGDSPVVIRNDLHFLSKVQTRYYLTETEREYFRVEVVNFYIYTGNKSMNINNFNLPANKQQIFPDANGKYAHQYGIFIKYHGEDSSKEGVDYVDIRCSENLIVEFVVQPIIYFEGNEIGTKDYTFNKEYNCDENGYGVGVQFSVAQISNNGVDRSKDISIPSIINTEEVVLSFTDKNDANNYLEECKVLNGVISGPIKVGEYTVTLKFVANIDDYSWIDNIELPININLNISKKVLYLDYDEKNIETATNRIYISKEYDKTNGFTKGDIVNLTKGTETATFEKYQNLDQILKYLVLKDKSGAFTISYNKLLNLENGIPIVFSQEGVELAITQTVTDAISGNIVEQSASNVSNSLYNLVIKNLQLEHGGDCYELYIKEGEQFISAIIYNFAKITKRLVTLNLSSVNVQDKVEDGSTNAYFGVDSQFTLSNVVASDGENVYLVPSRINLQFNSAEAGKNKEVLIDPTSALDGNASINYEIATSVIYNKTIYPYSVYTEVEGVGKFTLFNERGKTDPSKVGLLPVDAVLKVEIIRPETGEFVEIYQYIEQYLSTTRAFSIGYRIVLELYGVQYKVSNDLYLSVPSSSEIAKIICLSGEQTTDMEFDDDGNIIIDLSNMETDLDKVVLIEKRALLKLWQIILIVAGGTVVVGGAVTSVVIVRIRKKRKNELQEKI